MLYLEIPLIKKFKAVFPCISLVCGKFLKLYSNWSEKETWTILDLRFITTESGKRRYFVTVVYAGYINYGFVSKSTKNGKNTRTSDPLYS